MKRREFITVIGGAATWPFAARAQQPMRYRIGHRGTVRAGREQIDARMQYSVPRRIRPAAERDYIYQLLRDGKITDEARGRIERELDLEEAGMACKKEGGVEPPL